MAVEGKIKKKLIQVEQVKDELIQIQDKKEELLEAIKVLEEAEEERKEKLNQIEDYCIEHYASARTCVIELVKDMLIEIVIGCCGRVVYAVYKGIVATAKAHEDDEFNINLGETIAVKSLINKLLELEFGVII